MDGIFDVRQASIAVAKGGIAAQDVCIHINSTVAYLLKQSDAWHDR